MLSESNKKKVEKSMKNVEVVNRKRKATATDLPKQKGKSADELKKKYLNDDGGNKMDKLKRKFLSPGNSDEPESIGADSQVDDDNDIEVGLVKKKNQDAATDAVDERTIIVSKKDGKVGEQG